MLCRLHAAVFFDDSWGNRPSEEAYPCSPRGTGAKRCAGLSSAQNQLMSKHWAINMQAVKNATVEKVRKNVFCAPCYAKNDLFTKTGPGQT